MSQKKKNKQQRLLAVQRFLAGEKVADICLSLKRSRTWLYKWLARYCSDDPNWIEEKSRRPQTNPTHTPFEICEYSWHH